MAIQGETSPKIDYNSSYAEVERLRTIYINAKNDFINEKIYLISQMDNVIDYILEEAGKELITRAYEFNDDEITITFASPHNLTFLNLAPLTGAFLGTSIDILIEDESITILIVET